MAKIVLSYTNLANWFEQPITKVFLEFIKNREQNTLSALERINLRRSTDEVAMNVAELTGALKIYRVIQDKKELREIFRDFISWDEETEVETDGEATISEHNGRSRKQYSKEG